MIEYVELNLLKPEWSSIFWLPDTTTFKETHSYRWQIYLTLRSFLTTFRPVQNYRCELRKISVFSTYYMQSICNIFFLKLNSYRCYLKRLEYIFNFLTRSNSCPIWKTFLFHLIYRAINLGSRGPIIRQLLNLIQKTCFLLVKEIFSLVLLIFFLFTVKFHTLFQCLYLNYFHHSAKNWIWSSNFQNSYIFMRE